MQFSNSKHTVKLTPNQEICCYMYVHILYAIYRLQDIAS